MASDKAATDVQGARRLRRASYIVSSVGIIVAIITASIFFGVYYGSIYDDDDGFCADYEYDGVCYRHFSFDMTRNECWEKGGVYDDIGGCYYN